MLQSLNHDSWSKTIGIKPQIGTITDYWLRTSAEIHVYTAWARRKGTGCLFQFTYCENIRMLKFHHRFYENVSKLQKIFLIRLFWFEYISPFTFKYVLKGVFKIKCYEGGSICNENPLITSSTTALGFNAICQTKDQSVAVIMVHETLFYLSKFYMLQAF